MLYKIKFKHNILVVNVIIFLLLIVGKVQSHPILGIDIEASGSSFSQNGILSIGCSLQDENSIELRDFTVNIALPEERSYEEDCLVNFWNKNPIAHEKVQIDQKSPKEAMRMFCSFMDDIENEYPGLMIISDNPSFDIAWINTYLSIFTNRKPLNYSSKGEYRMIWDSASALKTWMSIKTNDFLSRHGHIKKLGLKSKWEHDHTATNDARRIADFFNQARREMKEFACNSSKKIEVVPYNPKWANIFETEAELIIEALKELCISVHHIGSTSVPELSAKPIIDIIVELSENAEEALEKLESIGYKYKGEFNIPLRRFMGKKNPFEVNLHVYDYGNPEVALNLGFRDFLRKSEIDRLRYESLKMKLMLDPLSHEKIGGFTKYTLGKNEFITDIIRQTGFEEICPRFCTHYAEWEAYHQIREKQTIHEDSKYDRQVQIHSKDTDYHLVLYKGVNIVGAAYIDMSDSHIAKLPFFYVEDQSTEGKVTKQLNSFLGKWCSYHGRKLVL